MAANRYRPHLLVIPEDDANRQIMIGFVLGLSVNSRLVQVEPPAGGWLRARDRFGNEIQPTLTMYPERLVLLLIDCDGDPSRLDELRASVPSALTERVFVLGAGTEPEELRNELGTFEAIGRTIAGQCLQGSDEVWGHAMLRHNLPEVKRFREAAGRLLGF